jgi:hypothetical protein
LPDALVALRALVLHTPALKVLAYCQGFRFSLTPLLVSTPLPRPTYLVQPLPW